MKIVMIILVLFLILILWSLCIAAGNADRTYEEIANRKFQEEQTYE